MAHEQYLAALETNWKKRLGSAVVVTLIAAFGIYRYWSMRATQPGAKGWIAFFAALVIFSWVRAVFAWRKLQADKAAATAA